MNEQIETAQGINGRLQSGDVVLSNADTDYAYLVGVVIGIIPAGSPSHDTENETDDVYVDFTSPDYSSERIREIEDHFSKLYGKSVTYDELSLDDVIMPPDSLLRITDMDPRDISYMYQSRLYGKSYCEYVTLSGHNNIGYDELEKRLNQNLTDFDAKMMNYSQRELIENAWEITSMHDAHDYLTSFYSFNKGEIDYLLLFQNPLEIISDAWKEHQDDLSGMASVISKTVEDNNAIEGGYPLTPELGHYNDTGKHRFMNVDILDFLGKIAEKVIIYYPNDWNIDKDILRDYALSENPEDKRLVWHVCSFGTHIRAEHDVFIKDSGAFTCMTDYRQNEPDMFGYTIEITGALKGSIRGNVYEVGNYAEYAKYIRDTAFPLNSVSLTYFDDLEISKEKTITVSRREYDDDRHRLMSESGNVISLRWHPANEVELSELLRQEHLKRMSYPIESTKAHIDKLTAKLAEVRSVPERVEEKPAYEVDTKTQTSGKTQIKPKMSIGDRLLAAKEKVNTQTPRKASDRQRGNLSID